MCDAVYTYKIFNVGIRHFKPYILVTMLEHEF
jgi:hypothetical protein